MPAEVMTETADDAFYSPPDEGGEKADDVGETASVDEVEASNPTALIPTSALGGKAKVGDSIRLKVVSLHDEEAVVEIMPGESESKPAKDADTELDEMAAEPDY